MAVAAIVLSSLALLASLYATYRTHRDRPRLREAESVHWGEVKQAIRSCLKELCLPDHPSVPYTISEVDGWVTTVPQVRLEPYKCESHTLFRDLKCHIPEAMLRYEDYLKQVVEYWTHKRALTQETLDLAVRLSGLGVYECPTSVRPTDVEALLPASVRLLYEELSGAVSGVHRFMVLYDSARISWNGEVLLRRQPGGGYLNLVVGPDEVPCRAALGRLADGVEALRRDMESGRTAPILDHHQDHANEYENLARTLQDLRAELEYWLAVPTLPGPNCEYIRRGVI